MRIPFISLALIALMSLPACAQDERTAGAQPTYDNSETYRQLNLFGDVFERVREQYVDPVDDKVLVEAAINGMLSNLDPHSSYLNEDSLRKCRFRPKVNSAASA